MLWREIIKVLNPRELFAMADILPFVRSAIKQEEPHRQDRRTYRWAEYDLVEMFPNIPREEVLTALRWVHNQLIQRITYRGGVRFFLSKGGRRKVDNLRVGARDSFFSLTFEDVMHYMEWDLNFNTCLLALSSVMTQVTGTAIGSSCSAQVASVVLIFRGGAHRLRPPATACDCLRKFSYTSITDGITHTLTPPIPPTLPACLPPSLQVCHALTH